MKKVAVKSFLRKGRIVRAFERQDKRKKKQKDNHIKLKVALGIAGALGLSAATYLVLKKRYVSNMDTAATHLKVDSTIGKTLGDDVRDMTFGIGGTGDMTRASTMKQSEVLLSSLKKALPNKERKEHFFLPLSHKMEVKSLNFKTGKRLIDEIHYTPTMIANLSKPFFHGKNEDSIHIANIIFNWHLKNPTKKINLVGYSAGGNIAKDVEAILRKKNISINLATVGTSDFGLFPSKGLHIMGDNDMWNFLKHPDAHVLHDVKSHSMKDYFFQPDGKTFRKDISEKINAHFFNDQT
jgi:hypothetical protein